MKRETTELKAARKGVEPQLEKGWGEDFREDGFLERGGSFLARVILLFK
jgi:hypothetical protein